MKPAYSLIFPTLSCCVNKVHIKPCLLPWEELLRLHKKHLPGQDVHSPITPSMQLRCSKVVCNQTPGEHIWQEW